jgi:hypothetical protein
VVLQRSFAAVDKKLRNNSIHLLQEQQGGLNVSNVGFGEQRISYFEGDMSL